jgi:hypothetical protein
MSSGYNTLSKCHTMHQDSPDCPYDQEHEIPSSQVVRNCIARIHNRPLVPISSRASSPWKIVVKRQGELYLTHSTVSISKKKKGKLMFYFLFFIYSQAYEAQHILRNGTFELPRMTRVLDNQRVCMELREQTIHSAPFF